MSIYPVFKKEEKANIILINSKNIAMNKIEPKNAMDLILNMDEYMDTMRNSTHEEAIAITETLESFAKKTVENLSSDVSENKKLISEMTDKLYRMAMEFGIVDVHTNGYIAIVLHRLFWELGQKGVRIFYILDNTLRDDRFKLILEQLPPAGFSVVTPHIANNLQYEPETTQTENLPYEEMEKKIKEALGLGKNIIYIERDGSVDYLEKVVELARGASDEYVKIYRNSAPESLEIIEIQ